MTIYMLRDIIKLKILGKDAYPELSSWALSAIIYLYKTDTQERRRQYNSGDRDWNDVATSLGKQRAPREKNSFSPRALPIPLFKTSCLRTVR